MSNVQVSDGGEVPAQDSGGLALAWLREENPFHQLHSCGLVSLALGVDRSHHGSNYNFYEVQ